MHVNVTCITHTIVVPKLYIRYACVPSNRSSGPNVYRISMNSNIDHMAQTILMNSHVFGAFGGEYFTSSFSLDSAGFIVAFIFVYDGGTYSFYLLSDGSFHFVLVGAAS